MAGLEGSLTAAERETVVTTSDADDYVYVFTAQRKFIRRLERDERWEKVDGCTHGGSPHAHFRIPADQWNPLTGTKRKSTMTEEQRKAAAERMRKVRAA